jgi:hypothetical protein
MESTFIVSGRGLGRRKALFEDFSVPLPPDLTGDDRDAGLTLRELIARIVRAEVEGFELRQEQRRLTRVMSAAQIDEGMERGKVDPGGRELKQRVDVEQAVGAAWQAFEDGLYLVVIDDVERRDLDAQVFVRPGSRVVFIRLVFLAGA